MARKRRSRTQRRRVVRPPVIPLPDDIAARWSMPEVPRHPRMCDACPGGAQVIRVIRYAAPNRRGGRRRRRARPPVTIPIVVVPYPVL